MKTPALSRTRGFSMIEMIGVISILAVLGAVITPALVKRTSTLTGQREDQNLEVIADGFTRYIKANQIIPGTPSWIARVATITSQSTNEIRRVYPNDTNSARVLLIHPGFTPTDTSSKTLPDPIWTQTAAGAPTTTNARILIISTHKSSLALPVTSGAAASSAAFEAIWDWNYDPATEAPPSGWPAAWNGQGEYLHVKRINCAPLFRAATFNNMEYADDVYPYYSVNKGAVTVLKSEAATDTLLLVGSLVGLYEEDGTTLDLEIVVSETLNSIYDNGQWRIP